MFNEKLYRQVQKRWKKLTGEIPKIANEGQEADYKINKIYTAKKPGDKDIYRARISDFGAEEYVVSCPFCSDTRQRLHILYTYGLVVVTKDKKIYFPNSAHCYNDDHCLQGESRLKRKNRQKLYSLLVEDKQVEISQRVLNKKRNKISNRARLQKPVDIQKLSALSADHPANAYLKQRGFSPSELEKKNGVVFVGSKEPRYTLKNRIFFPLFNKQCEFRGGQSRLPYDVNKGSKEKPYLTLSGTRTSKELFNIHRCVHPTVVITEGVFDALILGDYGAGMLGNNFSITHRKLLLGYENIVFSPDSDLKDKSQYAYDSLNEAYEWFKDNGKNVYWLHLPKDKDPNDLGQQQMFSLVNDKCGLTIQ